MFGESWVSVKGGIIIITEFIIISCVYEAIFYFCEFLCECFCVFYSHV
jgi:hypothetical protein